MKRTTPHCLANRRLNHVCPCSPAAPTVTYSITINDFQCSPATDVQQLVAALAQTLAQLLNLNGLTDVTAANIMIETPTCPAAELQPQSASTLQSDSTLQKAGDAQSADELLVASALQSAGDLQPYTLSRAATVRASATQAMSLAFSLVNLTGSQAYSTAAIIFTSPAVVTRFFQSSTPNAWTSTFGRANSFAIAPRALSAPPSLSTYCSSSARCPGGQYCSSDSRTCQPKLPDGSRCRSDDACVSTNCHSVCNPFCSYLCMPATSNSSGMPVVAPAPNPFRAAAAYLAGRRCSSGVPCDKGYSCEAGGRCLPVPGALVACNAALVCRSNRCRWQCPKPYLAAGCYQKCMQTAALFTHRP
jgi:hypothetical protein